MHSDGKLLNSTSALYICWQKKSFSKSSLWFRAQGWYNRECPISNRDFNFGLHQGRMENKTESYGLHNKWLSMPVFWQFDICNHISSSAGAGGSAGPGCSAEGALLWLTRQNWWAHEAAQLTHTLKILYNELWATFDFCCIIWIM